MKEYIIWSIEHNAWWGKNRKGYEKGRRNAGRYSFAEALEIMNSANIGLHDVPNEAIIKIAESEKENSNMLRVALPNNQEARRCCLILIEDHLGVILSIDDDAKHCLVERYKDI